MFAATLNRPLISLAQIFGLHRAAAPRPHGSLPSWINDPQLSEQLLKDTGLAPEDLAGGPIYDHEKPFFMQQNFW